MPTEFTLQELAKLTGVTPRTIRFYIQNGLLPSPGQAGPGARYTEQHLERLRLIRKLAGANVPLAQIRRQLTGMGDAQIATLADDSGGAEPTDTAAEYIRWVLGDSDEPRTFRRIAFPPPMPNQPSPAPSPAPGPAPSLPALPPAPSSAPSSEPDRAQWERVSLDPDIELHVRRPLTRQRNKRVERLISIARQLLEEE